METEEIVSARKALSNAANKVAYAKRASDMSDALKAFSAEDIQTWTALANCLKGVDGNTLELGVQKQLGDCLQRALASTDPTTLCDAKSIKTKTCQFPRRSCSLM